MKKIVFKYINALLNSNQNNLQSPYISLLILCFRTLLLLCSTFCHIHTSGKRKSWLLQISILRYWFYSLNRINRPTQEKGIMAPRVNCEKSPYVRDTNLDARDKLPFQTRKVRFHGSLYKHTEKPYAHKAEQLGWPNVWILYRQFSILTFILLFLLLL